MTIEIEEKVAALLVRLRAQAAVRQMPFETYLEQLIEPLPPTESMVGTLDEFDRVLDELAAGKSNAPSLPTDFSRDDIYVDHN
jgi:hypothetical protein